MAQPHIAPNYLYTIRFPRFSSVFEELIDAIISQSYSLLETSKHIYQQAEQLLLAELGLTNWQPAPQKSVVRTFAETQHANRLDAEYFQPKYEELINIISSHAVYVKSISELQRYNARGLQPQYIENGTLDVITSKHILENGLDYDAFEKTDESNWELQKKARISQGDILTYTTGANIGRTAYYSRIERALASNHVNILRVDHEYPEYVAFVMNSLIGRSQTERLCAGSAQVELYPKDIEKFIIPFIQGEKQKEIIALLGESHQFKIQSKSLLECAKRAVEIAIEQDEQAALAWLERSAALPR